MTRRATSLVVAVGTAAAVVALPSAAWAQYSSAGSGALQVTADVLAAPSNVAASAKCRGGSNSSVNVSWTPTIDTYATGYTVSLSTAAGTASSTTVAGVTSSQASLSLPANSTTYTVSVVSVFRQWTSTVSSAPNTVAC